VWDVSWRATLCRGRLPIAGRRETGVSLPFDCDHAPPSEDIALIEKAWRWVVPEPDIMCYRLPSLRPETLAPKALHLLPCGAYLYRLAK